MKAIVIVALIDAVLTLLIEVPAIADRFDRKRALLLKAKSEDRELTQAENDALKDEGHRLVAALEQAAGD